MLTEIFSNECFDDLVAVTDYIDYFSGEDIRTAQAYVGVLCAKNAGNHPDSWTCSETHYE